MTRKHSRLPTSTWMVLVTVVPAAVTAALLIAHDAYLGRRQLRDEAIRDGQVLSEPLLIALKRFLSQGSIEAAQRTVEDGARSLAVEHVALVDGNGKLIASDRHDWIGGDEHTIGDAEYRDAAAAARLSRRPEHRMIDGGRRLISVSPLRLGDAPSLSDGERALLYIRINLEERRREHSLAILERGALSALGVAGLAAFLLLAAREGLARRLREAAAHARAVREGRTGEPPPSGGGPGMALLVLEVGRMGTDLRDAEAALRDSEEHLREARRLAGVASRANAMAHDLNNLLTGILGYARVVLDRVGPGDPIRRQLAIIENVAMRAVDLTGGLPADSVPGSGPAPSAGVAAAAGRPARIDPEAPSPPTVAADAGTTAGRVGHSPDARLDAVSPATILAVDDESTVLALAKDVLEMHGHKVLTARNGEEALRVFRAHREEIDLVLLDLTMPVMGGRQCFRELRLIDPRVRVVISSGFSSESSASELLGEGAIDYLQKPYDIDRLARAVAAALTGRPPAAATAKTG